MDDVPLLPLSFSHICFILSVLIHYRIHWIQLWRGAHQRRRMKPKPIVLSFLLRLFVVRPVIRAEDVHARLSPQHKWPNSKMRIGKMWCLCALCVASMAVSDNKKNMYAMRKSVYNSFYILSSRFLCVIRFIFHFVFWCWFGFPSFQQNQTNTKAHTAYVVLTTLVVVAKKQCVRFST